MILTEDQRALRDAARRFSRERLLPAYQQREREGRVDRSLLREMGKLGFLGMDLADRYGGMDVDAVTTGMIIEELSYGDFNVGALDHRTARRFGRGRPAPAGAPRWRSLPARR